MNKNHTKLLFRICFCAILTVSLMVPFWLSACDWEITKNGEPITDNSKIKIGVSIWSSTDVLGVKCKDVLDQCARALGVNIQYIDQGHKSEEVVASVEKLCAAGCQGIILCNSSDSEMISALKTCNDNKVYLAQFFRHINQETNPEIYNMAFESPMFVGSVFKMKTLTAKS